MSAPPADPRSPATGPVTQADPVADLSRRLALLESRLNAAQSEIQRLQTEADRRNAMLNYAYAILRSALARALVAGGLLPAFGLHHASAANPFNLADDLIEPFRPLADRLVARLAPDRSTEALSVDDRRALAGVLLEDTVFRTETVTALAACERSAESLGRAVTSGRPEDLILPEVVA